MYAFYSIYNFLMIHHCIIRNQCWKYSPLLKQTAMGCVTSPADCLSVGVTVVGVYGAAADRALSTRPRPLTVVTSPPLSRLTSSCSDLILWASMRSCCSWQSCSYFCFRYFLTRKERGMMEEVEEVGVVGVLLLGGMVDGGWELVGEMLVVELGCWGFGVTLTLQISGKERINVY